MCALTPRQGRDWFGSGPESAAACRAVGFRKIRPKSFLPIIPARSAAKTCGNGRITAIRRIDLRPWSNAQLAAEGFEPALSHWSDGDGRRAKNSRGAASIHRATQLDEF